MTSRRTCIAPLPDYIKTLFGIFRVAGRRGSAMDFWGHSQNDDGKGVAEPLRDHITAVSKRAETFAHAFGAAEQAWAAGLLHDLGKYADQFQRRIRGEGRGRDHASMGALILAEASKQFGLAPALAIEGHHCGLGQFDPAGFARRIASLMSQQSERFTCVNAKRLLDRYRADGFEIPVIRSGLTLGSGCAAELLDVRMLFSALVDADFLETEAHFRGDANQPRRPKPDGPSLDVVRAIGRLNEYVKQFGEPSSDIQRTRQALFEACVSAGCQSQGLFTLSAPTGAGKTLAMLAFALHHAQTHHLRRIVLVMPFLNIIEQTAAIYRELFNETAGFDADTVLEDHSLARDFAEQVGADGVGFGERRRLLAENWDAPIILTTNVQCLESLMAHKPSRCRKLHRLAQSVILFDEVQTLPPHLAKVTLANLSRLAAPEGPFGSTVLFATATQPAFDVLSGQIDLLSQSGWQPREISVDTEKMFNVAARRVQMCWQHEKPVMIEALAGELAGYKQVLAIVNLKRHAAELARAVRNLVGDETVLHLSTNMCPAHRTATLKCVRDRLQRNEPVRLIATQCVEAGVDLDFPAVFRAMGPLEAIAQAAGRCNRSGKCATPGKVTVFSIADNHATYPPGYGPAVNATETFLRDLAKRQPLDAQEIINAPDKLRSYFRMFYGLQGRDTSELQDERALHDAIRSGDFAEIASRYRLITGDTISIVVPYDREAYERLRHQAQSENGVLFEAETRRRWRREAMANAVSIYRPAPEACSPIWNHIAPVQFYFSQELNDRTAEWYVALDGLEYNPFVGLVPSEEQLNIV